MKTMNNKYLAVMILYLTVFFFVIFVLSSPAAAWEDHTSLTLLALADSELSGLTVNVTSLEDFITDNEIELALMLDQLDNYLQKRVENYPALPPELRFAFNRGNSPDEKLFLALRINPEYRLQYYLKAPPGVVMDNRKVLNFNDMAVIPCNYRYARFYQFAPGEQVSALKVVATAADEPDYGFEIGLFEDSDTSFGKIYGFSFQPFGNPQIS